MGCGIPGAGWAVGFLRECGIPGSAWAAGCQGLDGLRESRGCAARPLRPRAGGTRAPSAVPPRKARDNESGTRQERDRRGSRELANKSYQDLYIIFLFRLKGTAVINKRRKCHCSVTNVWAPLCARTRFCPRGGTAREAPQPRSGSALSALLPRR